MGLVQQEEFYCNSDVTVGQVGSISSIASTTTIITASTNPNKTTSTTPSFTTPEKFEVILYPGQ